MAITVIIPTYRRPDDLKRCLEALKRQIRPADEILIAVRDTDTATQSFIQTYDIESLPVEQVAVSKPGQVAALNACIERTKGDIVCITDDDGEPYPQWLKRIEAHFLADNLVGGVGGRDWMYVGSQLVSGEADIVGKVQWFGRTIGNHHLGVGQPREVEILKGANMSYRSTAISNLRFDARLLGTGAEVHNDLAFSLSVKKMGWKLIYDPQVEINHFHGKRFDEDRRETFNSTAWFNEVHNDTLVLLNYLSPLRRIIYLLWTIAVGTRRGYGLIQLVRFLPREGNLAVIKWLISLKGRWKGFRAWLTSSVPTETDPIANSKTDMQLSVNESK